MKKLITAFFLIASIKTNIAQIKNWTSHSYNDDAKLLTDVNGFHFFSSISRGRNNSNATDSSFIIGVKSTGSLAFRLNTMTNSLPLANPKYAIKTNDNCILLVGEPHLTCDVPMQWLQYGTIAKIDTMGNVLFTNTVSITYTSGATPYNSAFTAAIQKQDSSYIVFSFNQSHHFSKTGLLLTTNTHTLGMSNSICKIDNSSFILSHSDFNFNKFISIVDYTLNVSTTFSNTINYTKIKMTTTGNFVGLTENHIINKLNNTLSIVNTSTLNQGNYLLNDFDLINDSIYACGTNSVNYSAVIKFDENLGASNTYSINYPNYYLKGISVNENNLNFVANDWGSINKSTSYFNTNKHLNLNLTNDAYITDITLIDGDAHTNVNPTFGPNANFYKYKLQTKIFNAGSDTLKSVYLNWHPIQFQNIDCGLIFHHDLFTNLSIPQNSFAIVTTNYYIDIVIPGNPYLQAGLSHTLTNICLWTSAPNFKSDANHTNDNFCGTIVLPITTSLKENIIELKNISISPNPTTGAFSIQLNSNEKHTLEVFDITGKSIHQQIIENGNAFIDGNMLSNSIYTVKVSNNSGSVSKKLVVLK